MPTMPMLARFVIEIALLAGVLSFNAGTMIEGDNTPHE